MNVIHELESRMHPESIPGFREVVAEARVFDSILLPERAMGRMVAPVQWVLHRVGRDGIRLTPAGYLPPAVVVAATTELDWPGQGALNRESQLLPLQELRGHLRAAGLLRVSRGRLQLTGRGRALTGTTRELWWHLARTIQASRSGVERDAVNLLLLLIARRGFDEAELFRQMLALGLQTVGWAQPDGGHLTSAQAFSIVTPTWRLLARLGVFDLSQGTHPNWTVTPGGAAFARAALQTVP